MVLSVVDDSGRVADRARRKYELKVNRPPEPVPGPSQVAAPGERLRFDASASRDVDGEITGFLWTFGDGHERRGVRYSVGLRVEDDGPGPSRTAKAVTEVWINAPPEAIAEEDQSAAAEEPLTFDAHNSRDSDGELKTFRWELGDGHEALGSTVEHAYAAPGRYKVTLIVEDGLFRNLRCFDL